MVQSQPTKDVLHSTAIVEEKFKKIQSISCACWHLIAPIFKGWHSQAHQLRVIEKHKTSDFLEGLMVGAQGLEPWTR